jgi:hypothetical protein
MAIIYFISPFFFSNLFQNLLISFLSHFFPSLICSSYRHFYFPVFLSLPFLCHYLLPYKTYSCRRKRIRNKLSKLLRYVMFTLPARSRAVLTYSIKRESRNLFLCIIQELLGYVCLTLINISIDKKALNGTKAH